MFNLTGKNILVTGAAGLLGLEFVFSLIKYGATCYAIDINIKELKKLELKLRKKNLSKKLQIFKIDITNTKQLIKFEKNLQKKNIFIDTIINNASNNPPPKKLIKSSWHKDIDVNLTSVKNIIDIFSKKMIKNKTGNIINIGSDLSVIAPDQKIYADIKNYIKPLSYSVTKHGIVGITKYYASLFGKYNVRVNCLSPGGVFNNQNKKFVKKVSKYIPLGRMANKNDYNGFIVFLSSNETKYMTGHNLVVDGGRTII